MHTSEDNTTKVFFFLKNLQGDITAVFNEIGECVLEYSYDAFGNISADLRASTIESYIESAAAIFYTPITYRGYMYDYYTGLYYLQSRYYNPPYGRFLNMDDTDILEKTVGTVHGANLFAYGNNNPVMNVDYSGENPLILPIIGIIFILFVVLVIVIKYALSEDKDSEDMEEAIEYAEKVKDLYDISEEYWFLFYYHAKNVVEYGTGINRNPTLPYFHELRLGSSYAEYCNMAYEYAVFFDVVSRSDRWSNYTQDEKIYVTRQILGISPKFRSSVISIFAEKFKDWGAELEKMLLETIVDFGTI